MNMIGKEQKEALEKQTELVRRKRVYLPFEEARKWAQALCFKSADDWDEMCNDGRRNHYIPSEPSEIYKDQGWVSWEDWLGIVRMKEFSEARNYAQSLELKSMSSWYQLIREGNLPEDIPERPMQVYKETGWVDFEDWLGL